MRRGIRTLAAAGLVVGLHLVAFLVLTRVAPGQLTRQEGPVFEVMLAPPLAALRRRPPQGAAPPIRGESRPTLGSRREGRPSEAPPVVGQGVQTEPDDEAQADRLRSALRQTFGCSQPAMARLNEAEREACLARFAAGAETATYRPPLMDADKQRGLERAAARKAADRAYRESVTPPLGIDTTGGGPVMNPLPDL